MLFNAHISGIEFDTLIIARSGSHAADILVTHWVAVHGSVPGAFEIFQSTIPKIDILRGLHELVAGGPSGIIQFDEDGGFRLEPM